MEKTILLIDGSSFIFRAFYAIRELTSPNGTPTNATYGIVNMLKQMQKKYSTPHWVCVFDSSGKTFRDDIYPEYKANRRETPPELKIQFPYIYKIIDKLGIPVVIEEGVEADDVIATIAKKYSAEGYKILIATGDKDFAQVVDEQITLVNTMTNEILDINGVINKFGVRPDQIIDYLSLIGDNVDNVPGVTKCGPKTAQKWLSEYETIDNLVINKDKLSGVVGENFRNAIEWLKTARELIKIDTNVNITQLDVKNIANLTLRNPEHEELIPIFQELNFRTWLKECQIALQQGKEQDLLDKGPLIEANALETYIPLKSKQLINLNDPMLIDQAVKEIIHNNLITSFYIFSRDYTNPLSAIEVVAISDNDKTYAIHLHQKKQDELFSEDSHSPQIMLYLSNYFNSSVPKICSNLKYSLRALSAHGIIPAHISGDITLASYIKCSADNHSLAAIINRNIPNANLLSEEEYFGKGAKKIAWDYLDDEQKQQLIHSYNEHLLSVHTLIVKSLDKQEQLLYRDVELPLALMLFQMEQHGMLINPQRFKALNDELKQKLQSLEDQIYIEAKVAFNINSPKQLQDILFNQLKLPTDGIKANTTGYSTDEESLSILADLGIPIANLLLEYRTLSKLLNTYVDKLPLAADKDSRLHTSLEQTVVTSGRLSSKDPNLQNIPVRNEYGQKIRQCFVAEPGCKLVCADYSQIELRILAHISNDSNLIEAFKQGLDIHASTASQIFNKPLNEVTKDERRYAKTINFGLIYGKSVFGLAKELKIERSEAKLYIDNYFAQFPKVKAYMEAIKQNAHKDGYVSTIYGRKIFLPSINSGNNILRQAEERLALNAPMQGSAADIIKIAMLNVAGWIEANKLKSKLIMQVHDELIFQVPENELELLMNNLARLMTESIKLIVPLEVDINAAENWAAAH